MNIKFLAACFTTITLFSYASCKKNENTALVEKDISTLSLSDLKKTLSGNWKLAYTWSFFTGRRDYSDTHINFYNFADSIKWTENGIESIRTNATYTKIRNYFSGDSTYAVYHIASAHNRSYDWSAEYLKNDTLILMEQGSNPTSYYLIH